MPTITGRKPAKGVKRTPAQVASMVAARADRLGSNFSVEQRKEAVDELLQIVGDYKLQLSEMN